MLSSGVAVPWVDEGRTLERTRATESAKLRAGKHVVMYMRSHHYMLKGVELHSFVKLPNVIKSVFSGNAQEGCTKMCYCTLSL